MRFDRLHRVIQTTMGCRTGPSKMESPRATLCRAGLWLRTEARSCPASRGTLAWPQALEPPDATPPVIWRWSLGTIFPDDPIFKHELCHGFKFLDLSPKPRRREASHTATVAASCYPSKPIAVVWKVSYKERAVGSFQDSSEKFPAWSYED